MFSIRKRLLCPEQHGRDRIIMNITYTCDISLASQMGGTRHVLEIVKNMGRSGHRVRLYAPRYTKPIPRLSCENVETIFIPTVNFRIVSWITFYILLILYLMRDLIARGRPDFVYSREMVYNILLPIFCKVTRIPLIIEVNALLDDELKMIGKGRVEIGLVRFCQKINLKSARGIIAVTEEIKRALQERYGIPAIKITVVSNGTDTEHFRPIPEEEAREKVGLEKEKRYIGFVGSCYPYHDIPTLIESATFLLTDDASLRFVIVGNGVAKTAWEEIVKKKGLSDIFLFTGYKPYEMIPYYMNAFDICVSPFTIKRNQTTGLSPMKLLDYHACGKAVVGSDIKKAGDILKKLDVRIAVPPEDPKTLAKAIRELLRNPDSAKEIGHRGRELILKQFTWKIKVREIMDFVEKLLYDQRSG